MYYKERGHYHINLIVLLSSITKDDIYKTLSNNIGKSFHFSNDGGCTYNEKSYANFRLERKARLLIRKYKRSRKWLIKRIGLNIIYSIREI